MQAQAFDPARLAPEVLRVMEAMAANNAPSLEALPIPQMREAYRQISANLGGEPLAVGSVREAQAEGPAGPIPLRLYLPDQGAAPTQQRSICMAAAGRSATSTRTTRSAADWFMPVAMRSSRSATDWRRNTLRRQVPTMWWLPSAGCSDMVVSLVWIRSDWPSQATAPEAASRRWQPSSCVAKFRCAARCSFIHVPICRRQEMISRPGSRMSTCRR
ncbi:hypothetical protein HL670_03336 [Serratia plymuthica]|nr:hypothetical protein HL670_03336 [Serratia plymuthica]